MNEITDLISRCKSGDPTADYELFDRLFGKLVARTRRNPGGKPRSFEEAESLAMTAFAKAFEKTKKDEASKIVRSGDLWALLIKITQHKSIDRMRKAAAAKRPGRHVDSKLANSARAGHDSRSGGIPLEELPSLVLNHEFLIELKDEVQRIRDGLGESDSEQVFDLLLAGHTQKEIAEIMRISRPAVSRKLAIIREDCSKDIG